MIFDLSLLAQVKKSAKLEEIAQGFQHDDTRPMELPGFQWFVGAICGLAAALLFMVWWSQRKPRHAGGFSPGKLFARALGEMNIGLFDRILLRLVARSSELDQPVVMLFSPALLDQQIAAWSERLSPSPLRRYARGRLIAAMDRVFVDE
jgi:hypothetical protein